MPPDLVLEATTPQAQKFRATTKLLRDTRLLALRPEFSAGAQSIEVSARRPDGGTEVLLFAKDFSFEWPTPYNFQEPCGTASGHRAVCDDLLCEGEYDRRSPLTGKSSRVKRRNKRRHYEGSDDSRCGARSLRRGGIVFAQQRPAGPYTQDQAAAGRAIYQTNCASCHSNDLSGREGPQLAGANFLAQWGDRTAGELIRFIQITMPPGGVPLPGDSVS